VSKIPIRSYSDSNSNLSHVEREITSLEDEEKRSPELRMLLEAIRSGNVEEYNGGETPFLATMINLMKGST
jgi:hypothetical protein